MFSDPIPADGAGRPAAPAHHAAAAAFLSTEEARRIDIHAHARHAGAEIAGVCEQDTILDHIRA